MSNNHNDRRWLSHSPPTHHYGGDRRKAPPRTTTETPASASIHHHLLPPQQRSQDNSIPTTSSRQQQEQQLDPSLFSSSNHPCRITTMMQSMERDALSIPIQQEQQQIQQHFGRGEMERIQIEGGSAVHVHDVLCGRGKVSFNHVGNKRFRQSITQSLPEYRCATSRSQKGAIVARIIREVKDLNGRFLKKNEQTGEWYELSDQQTKEKVSHAVRDAVNTSDQRSAAHNNNSSSVKKQPTSSLSSKSKLAKQEDKLGKLPGTLGGYGGGGTTSGTGALRLPSFSSRNSLGPDFYTNLDRATQEIRRQQAAMTGQQQHNESWFGIDHPYEPLDVVVRGGGGGGANIPGRFAVAEDRLPLRRPPVSDIPFPSTTSTGRGGGLPSQQQQQPQEHFPSSSSMMMGRLSLGMESISSRGDIGFRGQLLSSSSQEQQPQPLGPRPQDPSMSLSSTTTTDNNSRSIQSLLMHGGRRTMTQSSSSSIPMPAGPRIGFPLSSQQHLTVQPNLAPAEAGGLLTLSGRGGGDDDGLTNNNNNNNSNPSRLSNMIPSLHGGRSQLPPPQALAHPGAVVHPPQVPLPQQQQQQQRLSPDDGDNFLDRINEVLGPIPHEDEDPIRNLFAGGQHRSHPPPSGR